MISTLPKRRGVEDVDGIVDVNDADVAAGDSDVGRVLGSGRGALRRLRPWSKISVLVEFARLDLRRGLVAQKRPVYENYRHEKGVKGF